MAERAEPIVTIKQGQLKGIKAKDFDENEYFKFLGIPYAKPPVGDLRFKAPQPPEGWSGIRDASVEGSMCLSFNVWKKITAGSEDCLYLNVYTRHLPGTGVKPRPVMVHLHGGAFTVGSGNEDFFGTPDFLMTGDIVFVNINYRLGVFGFLSLEDPSLDVPGNAGLKDQRQALKWVQENIASFNGDPNNITIFGISAGGASVHFQMLSESSKGLFHKAISQSGTTLNPWAWGSKNVAVELAKNLDKEVNNDRDALKILMEVDDKDLFKAATLVKDDALASGTRRPFSPVIECPNNTAFLTKNPVDIMKSGDYNQVPLIIGYTTNEGLLTEMDNPGQLFEFTKNHGVPFYFGFTPGSPQFEKVKNEVANFYFKDGETIEAKHDMYSDVLFVAPIVESIKYLKATAKNPIYFYNFDAQTPLSQAFFKLFCGRNFKPQVKGTCHGNDGLYIFKRLEMKPVPEDIMVMRNIIGLWTSFAKSGRPIYEKIQWEPVTDVNHLKPLVIDTDLSVVDNPFQERADFWAKQFEKYDKKYD